MPHTINWQAICQSIEHSTQHALQLLATHSVSGGCINQTYILEGAKQHYFVKINQASLIAMFEAEFAGLQELAQSHTIKVPQPVSYGVTEHHAFLVLEKLTFKPSTPQTDQQLGQQLAALHQSSHPYFGWQQDNTIGSTLQPNPLSQHWIDFWREQRLGYQLKLAQQNGYSGTLINQGEKLADSLAVFFTTYHPTPALLHGDLWGGNAAVTQAGEPVIFDPACYYGDRETDLAMTELFGGFSSHFYAAYQETYPLHSDYRIRKTLYNLYHILNHLNLFGNSYQHQAQHMIATLLTEIA